MTGSCLPHSCRPIPSFLTSMETVSYDRTQVIDGMGNNSTGLLGPPNTSKLTRRATSAALRALSPCRVAKRFRFPERW